jgi:hypothetical protein
MMSMKLSLLWVSLLAPVALHATIVFSNVDTDTGGTVFYSTGPYVQIGDQLALGGTERSANTATTQFFDVGAGSGTFDATLRFFNVGSPVGSQIGSAFTVTGNAITSGNTANVSWSLGGLVVPTDVIFTVSVANLSSGLDLGLTLFDPPTSGSSSNQFFILYNGSTYSQGSQGNSQDNIYFLLDASVSAVPEPSTILLVLLGLSLLASLHRLIPCIRVHLCPSVAKTVL